MSRWQWLSTTGCGSGSGVIGPRAGASAVGSGRSLSCAPGRRRAAWARRSARATSAIACLRGHRRPSSSEATSAPASRGRGRRGGSGAPATTRVTSPRTPADRPGGELAEVAPAHLLVGLGQLPAHRGRTVGPERLGHGQQRRLGAVRRLEEHHRARLVGQRVQPARALACLARQEALEAEPVDRQPADRERGRGPRMGPAPRSPRSPASTAAATSRYPGSETLGMPGVGHQHHPLARPTSASSRLWRPGLLVALEVGHHPAGELDPEVGGQPLEPAGVLGGDHVGSGELGARAGAGRPRPGRSACPRARARRHARGCHRRWS